MKAITKDNQFWTKGISAFFILSGIILRLIHFFENRSLWTDEANIPLRLMAFSYKQLIQNFTFDPDLPVQPILFLLIEKTSILLLGNNELSLRFFPLCCGIASLFLFYKLLKQTIRPQAVLIAIGLFAFGDTLIYYSAEVKQYASDVFITLVLYLLIDNLNIKGISKTRIICLGLVGFVSVFLSHSVIFILASIGFSQVLYNIIQQKFDKLKELFLAYYLWMVGFIFFFFLYCRGMTNSEVLLNCHISDFLPVSEGIKEAFLWSIQRFEVLFRRTAGAYPVFLTAPFFILGLITVNKKDKEKTLMLIMPIVFALIASALKKYPFQSRFVLYFVPAILLFVSEGVVEAARLLSEKRKNIIIIGCAVVLLFNPVKKTMSFAFSGREHEEIRPCMQVLKKNLKEDDILYLNNGSTYAYFYYLKIMDFKINKSPLLKFSDTLFEDHEGSYVKSMKQYPLFNNEGNYSGNVKFSKIVEKRLTEDNIFGDHHRTWFVFSHYKESKEAILDYLDRTGKKVLYLEKREAAIYLYDLSNTNSIK